MQSSMTRIQTISVSVLSPPMMQYWVISQKWSPFATRQTPPVPQRFIPFSAAYAEPISTC